MIGNGIADKLRPPAATFSVRVDIMQPDDKPTGYKIAMRIPRIYHPELLPSSGTVMLSDDAANHVGRVMRMQTGQEVLLFDGSDAEFPAVITSASKKSVEVAIQARNDRSVESPLDIHLGQVVSRGEKMEFTIQKSVELGVNTITPLISERCGVKLNAERFEKETAAMAEDRHQPPASSVAATPCR